MANTSRRGFLKKGMYGLAALPLGMGVLSSKAFAQLPQLPEDHDRAIQLEYVTEAARAADHPKFKEGSTCANCMFYQAATQGCSLVPGFAVEADGWCNTWMPKP